MSVWDLLSVVALLAASAPSLYFAVRMRRSSGRATRLSVLLASAFLVHALFHLVAALGSAPTVALGIEALSAALIFGFTLAYWPHRSVA